MSAEVLCVRRSWMSGYLGLIPAGDREFLARLDADKRFVDRDEAEASNRYVQIIACAVIIAEDGLYQVFATPPADAYDRRGPVSLIVGGHIDRVGEADDYRSLVQLALRALEREIVEALGRSPSATPELVGFLIDGSSIKNSRHIGMLHECKMGSPVRPVSAKEFRLESEFAGTYTVEGLKGLRERMDPWSRIFTDNL